MMRWLVTSSLNLRFMVVAAAALLLVAGFFTLPNARLDVFPEFAPPRVEIQTECPGLNTEEVEALVTVPLESGLAGMSWMKTMRSKSVPGLSAIVLYFDRGTDLMRARQMVQERVAMIAPTLPTIAAPPVILAPLSATSRAMKIGLSSDQISLIELSTLARWTIRPRLMAVPGVANVAIWGQRDREFQALVDPDQLRAHGVSVDQVIKAAADATRPAAGGFIDTPTQRFGVAHRSAIQTSEELGAVVVAMDSGAPLTLADVAQIKEGHPPLIGDGVINDGPGILLIVEKQPWGNTLDVSHAVEDVLAKMKPGLPGVEVDTTIFRPATFIERSLDNLSHALLLGCILVILVLGLFLWEWRTALISALAIPVSLVVAGLVLHFTGQTINTMVLAGLVIALGEVVDDAIIDVENIVRRLRIERTLENPRPTLQVVLSASMEVRSAIVYATLIVILALVPIFMMEGLSGSFFRPLAISYALAVVASMLVALTLTPALCLLLMDKDARAEPKNPPLVKHLHALYGRVLPGWISRPKRAFGALAVLLVTGAGVFPLLGESFLPDFKETDFLMHWLTKPGTSLQEMTRITVDASKELRTIPGVRNFGAHIGRAQVADEVVGINFTELWISIETDVDYDETIAAVQEAVDGYPGLYRDLLTYLRERIKEVLSGGSTSIVVRIYGEDLAQLRAQAQAVKHSIEGVSGVKDLKVEPLTLVPQIQVTPDVAALATFGMTPGDVRRVATTLIQGVKVGEIYDNQKVFDVVVRGQEHLRSAYETLKDIVIDTPSGGEVRLGDVADIRIVPAANKIKREGGSRRIDVGCNVKDRALGAVATDIEDVLGAMDFPRGYHAEVLGEYKARQAAQRTLLTTGAMVLIGIFLLLQASFGSWRLATLVFLSLPAAMVGGVFAALASGGVLSLGSLVGFVTVLGIAARNGIMLVSHYEHLQNEEGLKLGPELVLRGAQERLSPILMTALTTGLALVPLVIAGSIPGNEIEHPMAVVILGGLFTSSVMNLLVVPALYLKFTSPVEPSTP
jgi:CzcA family heavy metal efflux pump